MVNANPHLASFTVEESHMAQSKQMQLNYVFMLCVLNSYPVSVRYTFYYKGTTQELLYTSGTGYQWETWVVKPEGT